MILIDEEVVTCKDYTSKGCVCRGAEPEDGCVRLWCGAAGSPDCQTCSGWLAAAGVPAAVRVAAAIPVERGQNLGNPCSLLTGDPGNL